MSAYWYQLESSYWSETNNNCKHFFFCLHHLNFDVDLTQATQAAPTPPPHQDGLQDLHNECTKSDALVQPIPISSRCGRGRGTVSEGAGHRPLIHQHPGNHLCHRRWVFTYRSHCTLARKYTTVQQCRSYCLFWNQQGDMTLIISQPQESVNTASSIGLNKVVLNKIF